MTQQTNLAQIQLTEIKEKSKENAKNFEITVIFITQYI